MDRKMATMKQLEQEIPHGEAWVRKMERQGHLRFKSEKVRGQVQRLFDQGDVVNALYVAALSSVGVTSKRLTWYKQAVTRFRKFGRILNIFKEPSKDPEDQFFIFGIRDIFPNGDPESVDWKKLGTEPGFPLLEELQALLMEAYRVRKVARNTRRKLKQVEKNLDKFIDGIEEGMNRCTAGSAVVVSMKQMMNIG